MPTRNAFATPSTRIGVAIEAVRGTPLAPTVWIPVRTPKYKPEATRNPDESLRGVMAQSTGPLVSGLRADSHGWDGYPFLDSFPILAPCELGSFDTLTAAPTATTLSAAAIAGATTVTVTATIPAGSWIVIGSGGTLETHYVTSVATDVLTLSVPLIYAQPSGATVTGLTLHEWSLLNDLDASGNQPPSLSITDFDGDQWRVIPAAQLDALTLKGNATGITTYTCTFMGDAATTPTTPTPSFTDITPVPSWTTAASIGGELLGYVQDWEFDFKRGVKNIAGSTVSQNYFRHFAGPIIPTGKLTLIEQSGAPELVEYLNNSQLVFDFTIFDVVTGYAFNIHSSLAQFKATGGLDRSKNEEVTVQMDVELIPNATDAGAGTESPLTLSCANATATAYYA